MKNKSALLAILLLTVVLGFSAVPVRGFVHEEIIVTDYPTDDVHDIRYR